LASDDDIAQKKKYDFDVERKKLETIHEKHKFKNVIKKWFHLFSSTPPQTDLEKFCGKLTKKTIDQAFESKPNSLGLAESFALLLLNMAHEFLLGAKEDKLVCAHAGSSKPNVVLFEVVTFLWAVLQVPVMRWAEDEMGLDEDSEICNNISASLFLTYGLMEQYWPNVSLDEYSINRIYVGKIDVSAAKLANWIYSDAGLDLPATSRKKEPDIESVPMILSCQLFAQHMVPAALETLKRQIISISTSIKK
jgi:hypothetical protein